MVTETWGIATSPLELGFEHRPDRLDGLIKALGDVAIGAFEPRRAGEALVELAGEASPVVRQRLDLDVVAGMGPVAVETALHRVLEPGQGCGEALEGGVEG